MEAGASKRKEEETMEKQYQMRMPGTVYSGQDSLEKLKETAQGHKKAVIFTDAGIRSAGLVDRPEKLLRSAGLEVEIVDQLSAEPSCEQAQMAVDAFRKTGADLIVAVGGGSVMDLAKLASICAGEEDTVRKLLEEPMRGKKQIRTVMIPTTAGTGSEATPNSIVAVPEMETKIGIVNPQMIPDVVILDGTMIKNLPFRIAAATGIDALAHAIECYTSKKANPFSDMFALEALKLIHENLIPACEETENVEAKNHMLLAAFYGGAAISASGTTAVHALAYPLGGKYHIAHGISNAIMLLPVMRFNEPACREEFSRIHDALGENPGRAVEEKSAWVLEWLEDIVKRLDIPSDLSGFGVKTEDLEELAASGMEVQRLLSNNRREVTLEDARRLYRQVLPKEQENKA